MNNRLERRCPTAIPEKLLGGMMHYERAALLEGGQIRERMTLYLEGKTPLSAMFFPPRRQLYESRHPVYRHGRAQGSDRDRGVEWHWQGGDGVDCGNQSQQHSAVYPRSAGRVA